MPNGYDTSFQPPDIACMAALGYQWEGAYVGPGEGAKFFTRSRIDRLHAAGLGAQMLVEGEANGLLGGYPVGRLWAEQATNGCQALGVDTHTTVRFYAADFDVETPAQIAAVMDAFRGILSEELSAESVGCYGNLTIIRALHDAGLAMHFILTEASSWNHGIPMPYIDAFQTGTRNMCGGNVDTQFGTSLPHGLWMPGGKPTTPATEEVMRYRISGFPNTPAWAEGRVHVTDGVIYRVQELAFKVDDIMSTAGAGTIVPITPADVYPGWDYAKVVGQLCGSLDPASPTTGNTWDVTGTVTATPA